MSKDFLSFNTKYKDDIKFQNLGDTLKALAYTFIHHVDLWMELSSNLESLYLSTMDLNAGDLYNQLMKSNIAHENVSNTSELMDSQLQKVAESFISAIAKTPKLSRYAQHSVKSDNVLTMWEYCHYFFVPVRLNQESIPNVVKIQTLRRWLTIIFTIPFYEEYARKYVNAINNIEDIDEGKASLMNTTKLENIINKVEAQWVCVVISEAYNPELFLQSFIRTFMNVALMASLEILKKYNPFIVECSRINPSYDGSWVVSLDPMFSEQMMQLSSLTKLLVTIDKRKQH